MKGRAIRLSIRHWVGVLLVIIIAVPAVTVTSVYATLTWWQQHTEQAQFAAARHVIGADATRWDEPTWQNAARAQLSALGVDALLFTGDGRQQLTTANALPRKPLVGQEWVGQKVAIPQPDRGPGHGAIAVFFVSVYPATTIWLGALAAGLLILLPTLAGVAWFLRQILVVPLTAMSQATQQIKDGRFDVLVPASRVLEMAEVATALHTMSAGLRDARQRQAAMEQERRFFISAVAHDLRTPVFTLRAYLGGLRDGLATTPEKMERYIMVCQDKAAALERRIADLFAFARIEYLEQEPRRDSLDLSALLRQLVEDLGVRATAGGIAVAVDDPGVPCLLLGDGDLLRRAVDNVLDNALHYTPVGGTIRVRWGREGGHLMLQVADTGPGVAAEDLPHLFEPLFRAESSRNRQLGGAGLGLTIARRILRAHGGDLVAANSATGGAIFTGTLPPQS